MNDAKTEERTHAIELEYDIGEPPQKVWRAISVPELRETWLPGHALVGPEATAVTPGEEIRYRMRDSEPPFLESVVTFLIGPNGSGGTRLRITQALTDARLHRAVPAAANNNASTTLLAA